MFDQAKGLYKLKRQSDLLKKQMERITIEVEEKGIRVVVRGDQRIKELYIDGEEDRRLCDVINKALKESQKKVAKKMRGQLGDLGIPGLS